MDNKLKAGVYPSIKKADLSSFNFRPTVDAYKAVIEAQQLLSAGRVKPATKSEAINWLIVEGFKSAAG